MGNEVERPGKAPKFTLSFTDQRKKTSGRRHPRAIRNELIASLETVVNAANKDVNTRRNNERKWQKKLANERSESQEKHSRLLGPAPSICTDKGNPPAKNPVDLHESHQ